MNMYCHRVAGEPPWFTWYKIGDEYHCWFRYSQIDIVRIESSLAEPLETFLLARIPTECNDSKVPATLWGKPIIYDTLATR